MPDKELIIGFVKLSIAFAILYVGSLLGVYRHITFGHRLKVVHGMRRSHVASYREVPSKHSRITTTGAEIVGAAMWWWILWHLWHESEHITSIFCIGGVGYIMTANTGRCFTRKNIGNHGVSENNIFTSCVA